jgi:Raf kinase inhibitor-like YbhB/YbcL family protein
MTFKLTVDGFREGATIPRKHTCEGKDLSPAIAWENAPGTTKSFALIVDDPDAPAGTWNHWLLWDIPAGTSQINEGFRPGALGAGGTNDFGNTGYGGPCPPPGHGPHRYFFKLYALDVASLDLPEGAKRDKLDAAMRDHVLAEAQYMGRYERK